MQLYKKTLSPRRNLNMKHTKLPDLNWAGKTVTPKLKQLIVAIDHGLSFADIEGLEYPIDIIERLAANKDVDGVIASAGIYKQAERLEIDLSGKARLLTVDYVAMNKNTQGHEQLSQRHIVIEPEEAVYLNPDAFKMFLNIYEDNDLLIDNIRDFERFATCGARHGIATLAEVLFYGNESFVNKRTQSAELLRGCRLAMELGADILKIPIVDDFEVIGEVVDRLRLPTFVLGGSKYKDNQEFLNDIRQISNLPVCGIMFGRNVWQSNDMEGTIRDIASILR